MNTKLTALCALMIAGSALNAAEMPDMPEPTPKHEWLQRFVGEWTIESEIHMDPDEEPVTGTGTETVRSLGGFWIVSEGTGEMMDMTMESRLTFGYDPKKEKYVGFWIDSMTPRAWEYEGTVDESGDVLTLTTRGFCPMAGKVCDFRSTMEFVSDDERVLTEKVKTEDDTWVTVVESRFTRAE